MKTNKILQGIGFLTLLSIIIFGLAGAGSYNSVTKKLFVDVIGEETGGAGINITTNVSLEKSVYSNIIVEKGSPRLISNATSGNSQLLLQNSTEAWVFSHQGANGNLQIHYGPVGAELEKFSLDTDGSIITVGNITQPASTYFRIGRTKPSTPSSGDCYLTSDGATMNISCYNGTTFLNWTNS